MTNIATILKKYWRKMKKAESLYWENPTDSNYQSLVSARQNYLNMKRSL